jgi:hypothetical protein
MAARVHTLLFCLLYVQVLVACEKTTTTNAVDAAPGTVSVVARAPDGRLPENSLRGVGWYPNVEVDDDNRLHVAYVDADIGSVLYAASAPGASTLEPAIVVDDEGAVGAYLRLSLSQGVPVFLYGHQNEKSLRLTTKETDWKSMQAAGIVIDTRALSPASKARLHTGFVFEELAFVDDAGRGASLTIAPDGRPFVLYYAKDIVRLARRPSDAPAFGASALGHWEKLDVNRARATPRVQTDLRFVGTRLWMSHCDDAVTDARLFVHHLDANATDAVAHAQELGRSIDHDGCLSHIHVDNGNVRVSSWHPGEERLEIVDGETGARTKLTDVKQPAIARRGKTSWWVLMRVEGDVGGLQLVEINDRDPSLQKRVQLERSHPTDAWMDLELRPDGRPVAVWFSPTDKVLRMYAP